jgi:SpoVK/Ycf46/Vps4 family AAA+-type ATPase
MPRHGQRKDGRKGIRRRRRHSAERLDGVALDGLATRITPAHGWDAVFASDDVQARLRELTSRGKKRGSGAEQRGNGITGLFSGPSRAGKTVAAEILAAHFELGLYRIDLARVASKYIGETEKNLDRVFEAAEGSGAILFFDEADALFRKRTKVSDSHDRYANVEINSLLQRMEDYAGLSILAINRRRDLGASFLRRLRFVVEFPSPPPETGAASERGSSRRKRTAGGARLPVASLGIPP